ncbi:TraR/DksA family transcriptional regulator [Nocardioides sp. MAHUQ-72]|uniref:TraR/DksA family transcriptional regulator n=1 Tax=unclassified Nocardioides TaxID=2615069 RepID=UPI0036207DAF
MDEERARTLVRAERERVQSLLAESLSAGRQDRAAEREVGDNADVAEPLAAEGVENAVTASLQARLEALDRAERRIEEGTYGRSVRSGQPIPDERLEADPAAELTVEESRAR